MIIYHQNNIAGFAGAHVTFMLGQQLFIAASGAAPTSVLIAQARGTSRFVFSRIHGRVD